MPTEPGDVGADAGTPFDADPTASVWFSGLVVDPTGASLTFGQVGVLSLFPELSRDRGSAQTVVAEISPDGRFRTRVPNSFLDGDYALTVVVDEHQELYRQATRIAERVTLRVGPRTSPRLGRFRLIDIPVPGDIAAIIELVRLADAEQVWAAFVPTPELGGAVEFFPFRSRMDTDGPLLARGFALSQQHGRIPVAEREFASIELFAGALDPELTMRSVDNTVLVPPFGGQTVHVVELYDSVRRLRYSRAVEEGSFGGLLDGRFVVRGLRDGAPIVAGRLSVAEQAPAAVDWRIPLPGQHQVALSIVRADSPVADCRVTFSGRDELEEVVLFGDADSRTDEDGRVTLSGLPAGDLQVSVHLPQSEATPEIFRVAVPSYGLVRLELRGSMRIGFVTRLPAVLWEQRPPLTCFLRDEGDSTWRPVALARSEQWVAVDRPGAYEIAVRCGVYWGGTARVRVTAPGDTRTVIPMRALEPVRVTVSGAPARAVIRFLPADSPAMRRGLPWEAASVSRSGETELLRPLDTPGAVQMVDVGGKVIADQLIGPRLPEEVVLRPR